MKFSSYVELHQADGAVSLSVRDFELFDFFDDHFVALGLEATPSHVPDAAFPYRLNFAVGVSVAKVWAELEAIGPDEIDRIAQLNHQRR